MRKRKICVVTGSRAEYGLLYWLMREIDEDPELELQIIATGSHLSPEYGFSYKKIEEEGFIINEKLEILLSSDTAAGMAKSLGLGVIGFADILQRLEPHILVLLGDRYEILAAAQSAMINRIPLAHIAGGETTEGAMDEAIRHSITKMSHLHFTATDLYRKRVIQLGEDPVRVFNCGSTGLDNIKRLTLLGRQELEDQLVFKLGEMYFLITYHPVTLENSMDDDVRELLAALNDYPGARIIITESNADRGGRAINSVLEKYAQENRDRVLFCQSLGQTRYLSALKHCSLVIGNSSSGIIEAPALKKATVNIGSRQQGRIKAGSIVDCKPNRQDIAAAIKLALSAAFQEKLAEVRSLYGSCDASSKIKDELKNAKLADILLKRFYDIKFD
jgi:UDP-N-acetyl-D-glucosamine 2-epimerase, UDP-hydrolysing